MKNKNDIPKINKVKKLKAMDEINSRKQKYCSKCGSVIFESDKFCGGCGEEINREKAKIDELSIQDKNKTEEFPNIFIFVFASWIIFLLLQWYVALVTSIIIWIIFKLRNKN